MREIRGEVGKKIPNKEMENMTSQEDDVVQKLCILGFVCTTITARKEKFNFYRFHAILVSTLDNFKF